MGIGTPLLGAVTRRNHGSLLCVDVSLVSLPRGLFSRRRLSPRPDAGEGEGGLYKLSRRRTGDVATQDQGGMVESLGQDGWIRGRRLGRRSGRSPQIPRRQLRTSQERSHEKPEI